MKTLECSFFLITFGNVFKNVTKKIVSNVFFLIFIVSPTKKLIKSFKNPILNENMRLYLLITTVALLGALLKNVDGKVTEQSELDIARQKPFSAKGYLYIFYI